MHPQPGEPADITIIGGGPVGLFAAFYAGLRDMTVRIIDSLAVLGGQLITLYPEKYIYDVAGFPKILAKELAHNLIEQALQYHPEVHLSQQVGRLLYDEPSHVYTLTSAEGEYCTKTILICAGIGAFSCKTLPLPEAESFVGRGLIYTLTDVEPLHGKRVLVIGGGDSAFDWANTLVSVTHSLTLIHRSDRFRALEDSVKKLQESPATILTFHELKRLEGRENVEHAIVYDNRSKEEHSLAVDYVVASLGFDSTLGPIEDFGLHLKGKKIAVDKQMRTNRLGIFAAGDVVTHEAKLALIATGFAEATIAVNFAKHYLDPKAKVFPGHSSEMKPSK